MTGNYLRRYGAALVAVIAALLLRLLLDPLVGDRLPLATVSAAIAFVAWYAGRGPAVLALVAGSAAIAYFIMEPRGSLQIGYREDIFSLVFSTAISAAWCCALHSASTSRALPIHHRPTRK